ncbi:hypothetical protein [Flavobacterium pedocola]
MKKYLAFIIVLVVIFGFFPKSKGRNSEIQTITKTTDTVKEKEEIEAAMTDTVLLGDINNDKITDTAFIYTPPTIKHVDENGEILYQFGCVDNNCFNKITFSCKIPEIYFEGSVWGAVDNAGDLNKDGYNELIFSPNWFTSCWGSLYLYSFNGKEWKPITKVTYRRCSDEPLKSHVIKIKNKYYLKGLEFVDGDDQEYKVEVKLK